MHLYHRCTSVWLLSSKNMSSSDWSHPCTTTTASSSEWFKSMTNLKRSGLRLPNPHFSTLTEFKSVCTKTEETLLAFRYSHAIFRENAPANDISWSNQFRPSQLGPASPSTLSRFNLIPFIFHTGRGSSIRITYSTELFHCGTDSRDYYNLNLFNPRTDRFLSYIYIYS